MNRLALVAIVVSCGVSGSRLLARQSPVFSAKVENVRVDVMVTEGGRPVAGLQPKDFALTDSGVRQSVDIVADEDVPVNVMLAFDISGSVDGERLTQLREAARAILDRLKPDDRLGLLTFASAVSIEFPLTTDRSRVRAALSAPAWGDDTALADAVYSAMTMSHADNGRALVIVLTDGTDTGSFSRPADVLDNAKRSDAVVYAVSSEPRRESKFLSDLCKLTGGRVLPLQSARSVGETFVRILDEFRHRYLLSYTPRGVARAGWHPISVGVVGRRASVTARPGYLIAQ